MKIHASTFLMYQKTAVPEGAAETICFLFGGGLLFNVSLVLDELT